MRSSWRWGRRRRVGGPTAGEIDALLAGGVGADGRLRLSDVDLRGVDLRGRSLAGAELTRVRFGGGREDPVAPAQLAGVSFRGATLRSVSFTRCELHGLDFRRAQLVACDLRYAVLSRTTFADAKLMDCDFYRAYFDAAVVMSRATMRGTSLDAAWLQGITALDRATIAEHGLVQEDRAGFETFLGRTAADNPDLEASLSGRLATAGSTYRALSAAWGSQGRTGDAGWAYARSRECERRECSSAQPDTVNAWARWLGLTVAWLTCGYGMSIGRVIACLGAVALVPALVYAGTGAVRRDGAVSGGIVERVGDGLLFSLGTMTSSVPERLSAGGAVAEWLGIGQVMLAVTLLGLLGFVLGNVIRSS